MLGTRQDEEELSIVNFTNKALRVLCEIILSVTTVVGIRYPGDRLG